jgi:hypothetical protein
MMRHAYTVVFHFPQESRLTSADIEDDIAEAVGNKLDDPNADHVVDGNEIGEGIDIFLWSRDPNAALALCRPILAKQGLLGTVVVAYASEPRGPYTVIHPPDFKGDFRA